MQPLVPGRKSLTCRDFLSFAGGGPRVDRVATRTPSRCLVPLSSGGRAAHRPPTALVSCIGVRRASARHALPLAWRPTLVAPTTRCSETHSTVRPSCSHPAGRRDRSPAGAPGSPAQLGTTHGQAACLLLHEWIETRTDKRMATMPPSSPEEKSSHPRCAGMALPRHASRAAPLGPSASARRNAAQRGRRAAPRRSM